MTLRIGVIGCGEIAQYVGIFVRIEPGLRITACCDRSAAAAAAFAKRFRVPKVYDSSCALMADPQVDALYLAVPHHLHRVLASRRAGEAETMERQAETEELQRILI